MDVFLSRISGCSKFCRQITLVVLHRERERKRERERERDFDVFNRELRQLPHSKGHFKNIIMQNPVRTLLYCVH